MIDGEGAAKAWVRALPECDDGKITQLERLIALLRDENTRQNLVSQASLDQIWQRHIADSAQLLGHVPRGTRSWMDLGTGGGFPGLVVGVLRPDISLILVESRRRRVEWLEHARTALGLTHVSVIGTRLESVEHPAVDMISARAFAALDRLLELSARFSTRDTTWLLPKGRSAAQELSELSGWRHTFHVERSITDPEAGIVVGKLAGRKGS